MKDLTFTEWFEIQLLAVRCGQEIDAALGLFLKEAANAITVSQRAERWGRVHDRLNQLGRFDQADKIREMAQEHGLIETRGARI